MTDNEWLAIVIALPVIVAIGVPLLGSVLRAKDFKAQITGKKAIRNFDEQRDHLEVSQDTFQEKASFESAKIVAELKSKQNILGPK